MPIRHPYNFVPLSKPAKVKWPDDGPGGHERFGGFSGTLECTLTAESLLCVKSYFQQCKIGIVAPYLPGSSLKGMVRTIMQMLGAGCGRYLNDPKRDPNGLTPLELAPCKTDEACLTCRLFGYTVEKEDFAWASLVRFQDSKSPVGWSDGRWRPTPPGKVEWKTPQRFHRAFYYTGTVPLGWKIYRHGSMDGGAAEKYRTNACVASGTSFRFDVVYENLNATELALLKFAVTLEHGCREHGQVKLWHKLGYGKALGFGSCQIKAVNRPLDVRRYLEKATRGAVMATNTTCELKDYDGGFKSLSEFLRPQGRKDTKLLFPRKDWFDDNPTKTIAEFENEKNPKTGASLDDLFKKFNTTPAVARLRIDERIPATVESTGEFATATAEWGGKKYTCTTRDYANLLRKGDSCTIVVKSIKGNEIGGKLEL